MSINYVIYHRDNSMLGLSNHIDSDGDLDANYALLRNLALSGKIVDGKFVSNHEKHFGWLIECATKGCPTCNSIFKDAKNEDYTIKPFYLKNVVKIIKESKKVYNKEVVTKWDKLAKKTTESKTHNHPLYSYITKKFKGETY